MHGARSRDVHRAGAAQAKTDSDLRHLLENYCSTQRGARFSYEGDYAECVLPGDESGALRFGTKRRVVKTPEDLAGADRAGARPRAALARALDTGLR